MNAYHSGNFADAMAVLQQGNGTVSTPFQFLCCSFGSHKDYYRNIAIYFFTFSKSNSIISYYYAEKKELFLQAVYDGGFRDDIINPSDGPGKIYRDFVQNCKGLDKRGWKRVFASLFEDKPGCIEFEKIANSEAETFEKAISSVIYSDPRQKIPSDKPKDEGREMEGNRKVSRSRGGRVKLSDRRLNKDEAARMVGIAFAPEICSSICKQPAVTHAAGSALAGLAIRTFSETIKCLQYQLLVRAQEMLAEHGFIKDRLDEHLRRLDKPWTLVLFLNSIHKSASSSKGRNIATMTLYELQAGGSICGGTQVIQREFLQILKEMKELSQHISRVERDMEKKRKDIVKRAFRRRKKIEFNREEKNWDKEKKDQIETALKKNASSLLLLQNDCKVILQTASLWRTYFKFDWDSNVRDIAAIKECKPSRVKKCPIPF